MKFQKKQLVLATMVLALGAAVYLTWQFSDSNSLKINNEGEESSELGAAQLVNNVYTETMSGDIIGNDAEETAGSASTTVSQARVTRQASRDEAIELLNEVLENVDADSEAKEEAVNQANTIAQNILKETNVENLLVAKGYSECLAYISNGECNVVVSGELKDADTLIIQEIVVDQTGLTADKIKIIGSK